MAKIDGLTFEIGLKVPASTVEKCLRILEMYLNDNPDVLIECERKEWFDTDEVFIKNELRIVKR